MMISQGGEGGQEDAMRAMMGPMMVDQLIRQAIQHCWMLMPKGSKTVDAVEAEIRRLIDRAIKDMREDAARFGTTEDSDGLS